MKRVTISEAQQQLPQLLQRHDPSDLLVVAESSDTLGLLIWLPGATPPADALADYLTACATARQGGSPPEPEFGGCRAMLEVLAEDEDHLRDFTDYMQ